MPQYVIIGKDGNDENALERRLKTRNQHLDGARILKANKQLLIGGPTFSENGTMNGSVMIVEFENETELKNWLNNEPYILEGVWRNYEIIPFKAVEL